MNWKNYVILKFGLLDRVSVKYPAISNLLIFEGRLIFEEIRYAKHKILIKILIIFLVQRQSVLHMVLNSSFQFWENFMPRSKQRTELRPIAYMWFREILDLCSDTQRLLT